jgi:hypothetical protein
VLKRRIENFPFTQSLQVARQDATSTDLRLLANGQEFEEVIDAERCHGSDTAQAVGGQETIEGGFCPRRIALRISHEDQLEFSERCEQCLVLFEVALEARRGCLSFVKEREAWNASVRDEDGEPIREIHQAPGVAPRQEFGTDAALRGEEVDFVDFFNEHVFAQVCEDEVQHHEP